MIISKCVIDTVWVHFKSYVMLCFAVSSMLQIIFIGPKQCFDCFCDNEVNTDVHE